MPGLTWEQAADTLVQKKSGMYFLGLFMTSEFQATENPADIADVDFFPWPTLGTQYDTEAALDAPIDIWMVSAKSTTLQADLDTAKAYMEFWSKGSTQLLMFQNAAGPHPGGQRHRHEHLQRPPEEGGPDRGRGPEDHPVPRS